ncbi:MAG: P-loop NTPase [Candidatus Aenigmatarchaeota archaeon]
MITGVFSGKGGVGKTTATINLGLAMKRLGHEAVIVDGDLRNPNLAIHLGQLSYHKTLQDILEKDSSVAEAVYAHETGLRFVPSHISLRYFRTDPAQLREALSALEQHILIDSPPGLSSESMNILDCCDDIVVVTQPLVPDIADCMKTIEVARDMGKAVRGIILNKVRGRDYELKKEEIAAVTNTPIISEVPWDENFLRALKLKVPLVGHCPHCPASRAFFAAASHLSGIEYVPPKIPPFERFMAMVKNAMRAKRR